MALGILKHVTGIVLLHLVVLDCVTSYWSDFELLSVTNMNGTGSVPMVFDMRAKRIKRGLYGMSGTIKVVEPLDGYDLEFKLYYSSNGGAYWTQSPFQILRGPICEKIDYDYRKLVMIDIHPTSDLPFTENSNVTLCDKFIVKDYFVKDYQYDSSNLPQILHPGLYKAETSIWKGDILTSGVETKLSLT